MAYKARWKHSFRNFESHKTKAMSVFSAYANASRLPLMINAEDDEDDEKSICFWSKDNLVNRFFIDSSLHGLKYIGQPKRTLFERLFWLVAFCASVTGCVVLILTLWYTYWESPVVTVFQPTETAVDIIPFPAITVCNVNNVRKSRANQYIERARDPNLSFHDRLRAYVDMYDLNHICEASTTFAQRFNVSVPTELDASKDLIDEVLEYKDQLPKSDPIGILRKGTQNCSELILLCLWLDEVQDCSSIFHGVETDYGFCCTFNVVPLTLLLTYRADPRDNPSTILEWDEMMTENKDNLLLPVVQQMQKKSKKPLSKYPYRQIYHGRSSGLSILLNPDLDEYFCRNTDADGFAIGVGNSLDFPRVRDHGIAVRPNSETYMSIKPDLTFADSSIDQFKVDKRQCYLPQEYSLKYYSYYSESNCVDECIANHTFESCKCIQYYMPRSDDQQLCSPDQFQCTEQVRKEIVKKGLLKECNRCLPLCNDVSYEVETTFLEMHQSVFNSDPFPGLNMSLNDRNLSIVHLYMGVVSSYPRLRKELYSFIDLVSSTGGLLSLFLGFSILSVLEICYFGTIRLFVQLFRKYSKEKRNSPLILSHANPQLQASFGRNNPKFASGSPWATNTIPRGNSFFISQYSHPAFGKLVEQKGFQFQN